MKITQLMLPSAALAAAYLLVFPATEASSALGGPLGTSQRDFRIFNNFDDATANNATGMQGNFPGYDGAERAVWKGCIEWNSESHASGGGDASQAVIGSGGANFDASWQGSSNGVGGTNDNVHSQLGGCNGNVLAFTETPVSNGWRIRYYECHTWADGPGTSIPGSQIDIQGVACHEYGHALGLGHTGDNSATMAAGCSPPCISFRSINGTDQANLQALYGAASGNKPHIESVSLAAGQLTITGSNFDGNNNDVWFTNGSVTNSTVSDPRVRVQGVSSSGGGTQIVVTVPAGAGSGDVLVKNDDLSGGNSLSNSYPYDEDDEVMCPPATNYCSSALNSAGLEATISVTGTQFISNNDFGLLAEDCPPNKFGIFYFGPSQVQQVFGEGFRCVGGSTTRLPQNQTDGFGVATESLDLNTLGIAAGETHNFQFWYRDPMGGPAGYNLTDAVEVEFCE